jgi:hypothetical protein
MRKNTFWKEHKKQIITGGITLILLIAGLIVKDYFTHTKQPIQNNTSIQKSNNKDSSTNTINTVGGNQYNAARDINIQEPAKKNSSR